jgi:hypothetical protein
LEEYGVDAVSYGHTHVYERYRINGIHYIEAASNGNNYRTPNDPPCSPNGYCPEFEENRFRSFLLVSLDPHAGMAGQGVQASVEANRIGGLGRVFDSFPISPAKIGSSAQFEEEQKRLGHVEASPGKKSRSG